MGVWLGLEIRCEGVAGTRDKVWVWLGLEIRCGGVARTRDKVWVCG